MTKRSAAQKLADRGTQQFTPWDPESGQLDMSLYEYGIRHPGIKQLGVLRDQYKVDQLSGADYQIPQGGASRLDLTPGQMPHQMPRMPMPGGLPGMPSTPPDMPAPYKPSPAPRSPGTFAQFDAKAGKAWTPQQKKIAFKRLSMNKREM